MPKRALSLRGYARHRAELGLSGGQLRAVQDAIATGRLSKSVTRDGKIRDADLADREWEASTYSDRIPLTGPASKARSKHSPSAAPSSADVPDLAEARARHEAAKAALAEIELAEKRGELVPAADVEARLVAVFSSCKTKLLGVPARARQQDPGLTREQLDLLEALIREALDDLAGPVEDES